MQFFPCSDVSYVLEWEFAPRDVCAQELAQFESFSWECDEEFVECETEADGTQFVRILVSTLNMQNLQPSYVQVHNGGANDIQFTYDLTVRVR